MANTAEVARKLVNKAIKNGDLIKPDACQLCGFNGQERKTADFGFAWGSRIVGHHWNGYDNPLDIWFICQSCNVILGNKVDLSLAEAKEYIKMRKALAELKKQYIAEFKYDLNRHYHPEGLSLAEWLLRNGHAKYIEIL